MRCTFPFFSPLVLFEWFFAPILVLCSNMLEPVSWFNICVRDSDDYFYYCGVILLYFSFTFECYCYCNRSYDYWICFLIYVCHQLLLELINILFCLSKLFVLYKKIIINKSINKQLRITFQLYVKSKQFLKQKTLLLDWVWGISPIQSIKLANRLNLINSFNLRRKTLSDLTTIIFT